MQITIAYDSSWRNSFLSDDADNNQPIPNNGRKYIASITALKNKKNYLEKNISLNTVMGVLNRLIGDQRKLYKSRLDEEYYFAHIEGKVTHKDYPEYTQEMVYLRNISSGIKDDPTTTFTGAIKVNDPILNSEYSNELWGVLVLNLDELFDFIVKDSVVNKIIEMDPLYLASTMDDLSKLKKMKNSGIVASCINILETKFPYVVKNETKHGYLDKDGFAEIKRFYFAALYIQLERLGKKYDMSSAITSTGVMKGISKRNFTKKDFIEKYTTGRKKILFGNPYIHDAYGKGGKTRSLMTKASGKLEIYLDISKERAKEIRSMIRDAGVSSFYLGKKGLAYVEEIKVAEVKK